MNVQAIGNFNVYKAPSITPPKNSRLSFRAQSDVRLPSYIREVKKNSCGQLQSIIYKEPLPISKVFENMTKLGDPFGDECLVQHAHTFEELVGISYALNDNPKVGAINVKSLLGFGVFALAFETVDGLILKISDGNHFPENRARADFDLPIKEGGKISNIGDYYYYIEEKVSQDKISDAEIKAFAKYVESNGYILKDYDFNQKTYTGATYKVYKKKQFGHASDGKLYLIDPGCAIKKQESFSSKIKKIIQEKIHSFSFKRFPRSLKKLH